MNNLKKAVINIVENNVSNKGDFEQYKKDIEQNGCISGMVSELIYYSDTTEFYGKHKTDINMLLGGIMYEHGFKNTSQLFGDKWDTNDPMAFETQNKNLLAWFGFEETIRNIQFSDLELTEC